MRFFLTTISHTYRTIKPHCRAAIIRGNADKPVALETKLGYVLSRKLDIGSNGGHQINLNESLVTNVLRVQQELTDPKEQLNEIVQKFWNLESVGVSKTESDVCENLVFI